MKLDKASLPYVHIARERRDYLLDPMRPDSLIEHHVEIVDESEFNHALLDHLAERGAHRYSVGVPAPFPSAELLRTICEAIERGESLELEHAAQFDNDFEAAKLEHAARNAPPDVARPSLWQRIKQRIGL